MNDLMALPYSYTQGSTVTARVAACNSAGCGQYSSSGNNGLAVINTVAPQVARPTEVSLNGNNQFTGISWNLVNQVAQNNNIRYNVQYADDNSNGIINWREVAKDVRNNAYTTTQTSSATQQWFRV